MSELAELAQLLIRTPLVARPEIAELRHRNHRRHVRRAGTASTGVVVALALTLGMVQLTGMNPRSPGRSVGQLASYFEASVNIPDSTLAAVGTPATIAVPAVVTPSPTSPSNRTISYVGAEYCPYCSLQRWSLLIALSKFGTFVNLSNAVYSSSTDVFPHLASWSFVGARYTSPYFTFDPTELTSSVPDGHGGYRPLEKMNPAQKASFDLYDGGGSLPFVDVGNHVTTVGSGASLSVLEGLTLAQIGTEIQDPHSRVAQAVDGEANYLIAAMCSQIHGSRPPICASPAISLAQVFIARGYSLPTTGGSGLAPVQPPADAPMSIWYKWSDEMHAFLERQLPLFAKQNSPGCRTISVEVDAMVYTKTTLGIPPGVKSWSISGTGYCRPASPTHSAK